MDVSSRRLRYFVAVAEELHFGRAAARLFVTQQALSKQIRELEREIGTQLLRRTTRTVELTPAGEALLAPAREALTAIGAGVEAARRAGRGEAGTLRLGFVIAGALELTTPILAEFTRRNPGVLLQIREFGFPDPSAGLAAGDSDVALVRLPLAAPDLESYPLFHEPLVAAVPRTHRLAGRPSVTVRDLLDEPLAVGRTADTEWRGFWALDAYRPSGAERTTIETSTQSEEAEMVAAGLACAVTTAGAERYAPHRGIRYIPIGGVGASTLAAAWRKGHRTALVDRFLAAARAVLDHEADLLAAIEHPWSGVRHAAPPPP